MIMNIVSRVRLFFSIGLRPFFMLTALSGVFFPMYLVANLLNDYSFNGEILGAVAWHGHELLFGLIPALLTGFLLTASANWTGKPPIRGWPLFVFVLIWILTRIIFWYQPSTIALYVMGPASPFILLFHLFFRLKENRNRWVIALLLGLLIISDLAYIHSYVAGIEKYKELALIGIQMCVFLFLLVFSGRLIPFFINSRFEEKIVEGNLKIDLAILISSLLFFSSFLIEGFPKEIRLADASIMFILFIIRARNFYHPYVLKEPMVLCLHMAHFWLMIYFPVFVLEEFFSEWNIGRPGLHALFTGALAMFAVSIMSRASLGHTGRKIESSHLLNLTFACVFLGALGRVFLPIVRGELYDVFLHITMGTWTLGFIFFLIKFIPVYFSPRADGKPA